MSATAIGTGATSSARAAAMAAGTDRATDDVTAAGTGRATVVPMRGGMDLRHSSKRRVARHGETNRIVRADATMVSVVVAMAVQARRPPPAGANVVMARRSKPHASSNRSRLGRRVSHVSRANPASLGKHASRVRRASLMSRVSRATSGLSRPRRSSGPH